MYQVTFGKFVLTTSTFYKLLFLFRLHRTTASSTAMNMRLTSIPMRWMPWKCPPILDKLQRMFNILIHYQTQLALGLIFTAWLKNISTVTRMFSREQQNPLLETTALRFVHYFMLINGLFGYISKTADCYCTKWHSFIGICW